MSLSYHIPNFVSIGQIFHHSCRSFCGEACPAITVARYQCVFFFFSPASLLFLSSTILWMAEAAGREKTTEARRNERLCPRCPWLAAVFCQQSLSWQLYGKRSGNLFNVFYIKKSIFLISKDIFWYQKIDFSIFWYQNIDFLISKNWFFDIKNIDFLISEIDFLISENIFDIKNGNLFWYQKVSLIFWYQKMNFWYQKIQNKFPLRTLFFYIKNIEWIGPVKVLEDQ